MPSRLLTWFGHLPSRRGQALSSIKSLDGWVKVCLFGQNVFQQINAYHTIYTTLKGLIYDHRLANFQEAILIAAASLMLAALLTDLFVFTSNKPNVVQSPHWVPGIGFFFTSFVVESIKMTTLFFDGDTIKHGCQQTLTAAAGGYHPSFPPDNYTSILCELKRDMAQMSGSFGFFLQTLLIVAYVITARLYMARRLTLLDNQGQNVSLYTVNRNPNALEHSSEFPAAPPYRTVDPLNVEPNNATH